MNAGLLTLALTIGQPGPEPYMPPGPPLMPASPFVFVTVTAPTGTKTTWHPLTSYAKTTAAAGLRPGYLYRFQLSDVPGLKGSSLFPSIEVRGTLIPRKGMPDISKHPVPITFTDHDIDQIVEGKMITKVYYLEDPEQALPIQGKAGEPLEGPAATEIEAIREAKLRGRPMLIVRVGERQATKEDLEMENTPGTILFQDSREMPMPAAPPRFAFNGIMLFDPIIGPRFATEECLKDGGDVGPRMGPGADGKIGGVDPTDTGMMFTTRRGTKVVASNRVGICVPRFACARVETALSAHFTVTGPDAHHHLVQANDVIERIGTAELREGIQLAGFIGAKRASVLESRTGPEAVKQWSGRPAGLSSINGAQVVAQARGPEEITSFPGSHSLLLRKSIDPPHPENIGDLVTVTLRFSNPTTEEMSDIVIADSLTGRLEYIEGTTKSTRATSFTTTKNQAGSVVLRWAVDGTLKPGESGKIAFLVRIR
jgi:hypothetical protein